MNLKTKKLILILFFILFSFFLSSAFLGIGNLYLSNIDWLLGSGDITNGQNGWTFFKNDTWRFPLGENPNYGLDISSSIIFSDSLPLFAFIFKIFKSYLSENFQYFSLWIFLCFFLQSYLSYLIIYKTTNDIYYSLISSFIFTLAPIFIYRLGFHLSLGGQWLILLGYYIIFHIDNERKKYFWIFLLILSTLVHLYFTVMLFAMYGLSLIQIILKDKKIIKLIVNLSLSIIVVLISMFVFGYFTTPLTSTVSVGYGTFGLDILGIIDPQTNHSELNWSYFLSNKKGTGIEGFNYLGLGCIILLLTALTIYSIKIFTIKNYFKDTISKNISIILIALFLTCWSITTSVYLGGEKIFNPTLNDYIFGALSIFAATGRFFWPVYYLLIILSLVYIYKNFKKKHTFLIIVVIFLIQIIDILPGLNNYFLHKNHITKPKILQDEIWKKIPKDYEKFRTTYLYHNYGSIFTSLGHFLGTSNINKTDIILVAGLDRSKAALARYNFNQALYDKKIPRDTAYVIDNLGHLKQLKYFLKNTDDGFFYRDNLWLLLPGKKTDMSPKDIENFSKIKLNYVNTNKKYEFDFRERGKILGVGWSHNQGNIGVWSEGNLSFLLFSLRNTDSKKLKVKLNSQSYEGNKNKNFEVKIYFNDIPKKAVVLNNLKEDIIFDINKNELKDENIIMFKFENLISPLDIFESPDGRKLGILLKDMIIEEFE